MTARDLDGVKVVVLRAGTAADPVRDELASRGARARTVQTADVVDRPDAELQRDVGDLANYRWVAVTSANAARRLSLWASTWPAQTKVAAVGPTTQRAVSWAGLTCDAVSTEGTGASLAEKIDAGPVLFVAARSASTDLVTALATRDIDVTVVAAYDVTIRSLNDADRRAVLDADVLVAMSPTACDAIAALDETDRVFGVPLVAIGPTTRSHASALGWRNATEASARDSASVTEAVIRAVRT
jgi:uroporphyrinogen-III synthase